MTIETHVIGDGCSAMMVASRADELEGHNITLVRPDGAPPAKDHMLGFWNTPGLKFASKIARASWSNWSIITDSGEYKMSSKRYAYHAMHKEKFLESCHVKADMNDVKIISEDEAAQKRPKLTFDSRPPRASRNAMLQHFLGQEVIVDKPVFDDSTAILMDFRVEQSHGMHFIYLLPFSPTQALVESTLFSTKVLEEEFYIDSINQYLSSHLWSLSEGNCSPRKGSNSNGQTITSRSKNTRSRSQCRSDQTCEWIRICIHASANPQGYQENKER